MQKKKKKKELRILIILECIECRKNEKKPGISRYHSEKNRANTTKKLELKKFCKYCITHTIHKEIK
jgi:large subunit ribosomal protein L33